MSLLEVLVQTQLSEATGWTLIHFFWEGAVIAAGFAVMLVLVSSPRIRYTAG